VVNSHSDIVTQHTGWTRHWLHDRIAIFAAGRLVADGLPADVLTAGRIESVYGQAVTVMPHPVTGGPMVVPL